MRLARGPLAPALADGALARWQRYAFTRALRAVDPARVTAEARDAADGPLRGLLFSVKDLFPVAGVESCAGSLLLAGSVPGRDPALIAAVRAAGAVVLGKGVCAEFGFGVDRTENRLDGRVRHFRDPAVSPGGSSGGDAVAVGAGIVDFAVAGDYGGSVRWPAQAAGILGLRLGDAHPLAGAAATGRIGLRPADGAGSLQSALETAGLMARSAAVLRAVLTAITDGNQAGGTRRPLPAKRLLVTTGTEVAAVRPEVSAAVAGASAAATAAGYTLAPASDELRDALRDAVAVYAALRAATDDHHEIRRLAEGREDLLCESTRAVLDPGLDFPGPDFAGPEPAALHRLRARAGEIRLAVRAALRAADADALLMPVAASGPTAVGARVTVAGRVVDAAGLMAHCRAVSLTGLPALSMPARPAGWAASGPGLSVQLVGADGAEDLLAQVAHDLGAR